MGYYASGDGSHFKILRKDIPKMLSCIKEKYEIPDGHSNNIGDEAAEVLYSFGFYSEADKSGDIITIYYDYDKFHADDTQEFFNVIWPYVQRGSYVAFAGEDYSFWAYYFGNDGVQVFNGEVVYPGMPIPGET